MIKANELRLGNWVFDPEGEMSTVNAIGKTNYSLDNFYHGHIDDIKPIPLTEDILLKCGFEFDGLSYIKEYGEEYFFYVSYDGESFVISADDSDIGKPFYYLHQLQNLYWCLCGEELLVGYIL